jgi:hypothetical protein
LFPQFKKLLRPTRSKMHTTCAKEIHSKNLDRIAIIQDIAGMRFSAMGALKNIGLKGFHKTSVFKSQARIAFPQYILSKGPSHLPDTSVIFARIKVIERK